MSRGIFSVSRDIFDHPIVGRDPTRFRAWLWMVSCACWKPTRFDVRGKTITIKRGQFSTSYTRLAEELGWSRGHVQRFLTRLKTDTMIDTETDTGQLVITICNYEKYQLAPISTDTLPDTLFDTTPIRHRYTKEEGNKVNKREEENSTAKKPTPLSVLSPLLGKEMAVDVIEHRQRIRSPMTTKAAQLLAGKLQKCPDPVAGAEMMIENGWRGFDVKWFETKRDHVNGARPRQQTASDSIRAELRAQDDAKAAGAGR